MDNTKANILIVDDNLQGLRLLMGILTEQYDVRPANSGQTALRSISSKLPDLILLDIEMPEMNGYEVCKQLKASPETKDIPVIFISALDEPFDKVKAFNVGGVDYITKPYHVEEVLARISTHLSLFRLQQESQQLNERLRQLLRQFASKEVADEILKEGFSLGGKRVEVTAMFADIRSFTSITESQPPEATVELLNDYFAHMLEIISQEGGIVNQIVGDGFMCIFGAPIHQNDHAQRAVRAALAMMSRIEQFNQEQSAKGKVTIRIGIGIATGPGVAGYVGTQTRTTYTCVGSVTNLAARLEATTKEIGKPILIDSNTQRALDKSIIVEDEGQLQLRGMVDSQIFSVPLSQD